VVPVHAQAPPCLRSECVRAHGLARLGAADPQARAAGRFAPEVVVERDDAVDLGARQVQGFRHLGHGLVGQVAELLVQRAQHRQRRPVQMPVGVDDRGGALRVPAHGGALSRSARADRR
jgi:hypothetical protein